LGCDKGGFCLWISNVPSGKKDTLEYWQRFAERQKIG
jgi:hypothetical protein